MRTKTFFSIVSILVMLTIVLAAVGSATADKPPGSEPPCVLPEGAEEVLCHHDLGNGVCQEKTFKRGDNPPGNEWFLGGCPVPTEPPATTEPPIVTEEPPATTEPPVITEPPATTEPPIVTEEPPVETQEPPIETVEPPSVVASDNDIAAVTWMSTQIYHNGDKVIIIKWIGDAGYFRLCKKLPFFGFKHSCQKLPVPPDAVAVTFSEMRGTLTLPAPLAPGTYWLYAHHWQSGNTGNDNTKFNKFEVVEK